MATGLQTQTIMLTGAAGLIGRTLSKRLGALGASVVEVDKRHAQVKECVDVCDPTKMCQMLEPVSGVIHLAAVSRVVEGESDPGKCWAVNVEATKSLLELCLSSSRKPWFLYASSREVYGEQDRFPVRESALLRPMNVYGRSKVASEQLTAEANERGLTASVVRFSNVYGDTRDHADRVVPAFARTAAQGGQIRVDGQSNIFDFTHVDDVADGICLIAAQLASGERKLPPIHFVTGVPTTLGELADLVVARAKARVTIVHSPPRLYDVSRFHGDPSRARDLLGWSSRIDLQSGFSRLAMEFAEGFPQQPVPASVG